MKLIQQTLTQFRKQLEILDAFDKAHKIPDGLSCSIRLDQSSPPVIEIWPPTGGGKELEAANRTKVVAVAGEVFSPERWTRKLNYDRTSYDWYTVRGGVTICINGAELVDDPRQNSPVHPGSFPLLIEVQQDEEQPPEEEAAPELSVQPPF